MAGAGGKNGRGGGLWLNDDTIEHGVYRRFSPGDRIRFRLGGGGGFGDPLDRDPNAVADDVREGLVSVGAAAADYGVVIDPDSFAVDLAATGAARLAARRQMLT